MSELRHTPKPWRYNPAIGAVVCDTPVGAEPLDPETREYYGGEVIAETVTPANGTLIASAPELLEACKLAFKLPRPWMDGGISYLEWDEAIEKIDAAIAKATGRNAE